MRDEAFVEELRNMQPDVIVVVAFGQILSKEILEIPSCGCINVHASLLPKYRGANPIQRAIINGDKETGICTMITELGLDCGDICLQYPIKITPNMNCLELFEICSAKSPALIEQTLLGLVEGSITPQKQCENGVCFADKLQKEECQVDWTKSAEEIHNLVRGVYKCPSAYFNYQDKIIKVLETEVINENSNKALGEFVKKDKTGIYVQTGNGQIKLLRVKPEGKGEMLASDWANGLHI